MYIMGLDMGTSGCKAVVFDEKWRMVYRAYREYDLIFSGEGLLELDPALVWDKIKEAMAEANANTGRPVKAVAVSAIGDVIIPLDVHGNPVRHSIIDFDPRGKREIEAFTGAFGVEAFFGVTGMPPLFIGSLAKMLWLKKYESASYARVRRWATYEDFIVEKMGLAPYVSYSEAARTMLFDIRKKTWSQAILDKIPMDASMLPEPVPPAKKLGLMDKQLARELGFKPGVQVVSGGHDMVCAAVGAGLDETDTGTAVNIAGTIEGVVAALDAPNTSGEMLGNLFPCYPGHRGYVTFSVNLTSGCIQRWYRDNIAGDERDMCAEKGIDFYDHIQRKIDVNAPGNLLFLPHFSGSGNPYFDSGAKGAVYGLTLDTAREDISRAMIEGLSYEIKLHCEAFARAGIRIHTLRAVGGGARLHKQLQLKANITGLTVVQSPVLESSALGAAAYAGVAMGLIGNPAEAYTATRAKEKTFTPDPEATARFAEGYQRYKRFNEIIHGFESE
jgi:xylulokinase